jgi:hypothetical protein
MQLSKLLAIVIYLISTRSKKPWAKENSVLLSQQFIERPG